MWVENIRRQLSYMTSMINLVTCFVFSKNLFLSTGAKGRRICFILALSDVKSTTWGKRDIRLSSKLASAGLQMERRLNSESSELEMRPKLWERWASNGAQSSVLSSVFVCPYLRRFGGRALRFIIARRRHLTQPEFHKSRKKMSEISRPKRKKKEIFAVFFYDFLP